MSNVIYLTLLLHEAVTLYVKRLVEVKRNGGDNKMAGGL